MNLPKERTFKGPAIIWKRVAAFVTDILIINFILFFPFRRIITNMLPRFGSYSEAYEFFISNPGYSNKLMVVSLTMAIFAILYFTILEYKLQQTPGKMLFNISVISETKKLRLWQCISRSLFLIPMFPFILLWIVDPLFMIFTKTNQRLSEILSKTRTIETYVIG